MKKLTWVLILSDRVDRTWRVFLFLTLSYFYFGFKLTQERMMNIDRLISNRFPTDIGFQLRISENKKYLKGGLSERFLLLLLPISNQNKEVYCRCVDLFLTIEIGKCISSSFFFSFFKRYFSQQITNLIVKQSMHGINKRRVCVCVFTNLLSIIYWTVFDMFEEVKRSLHIKFSSCLLLTLVTTAQQK